jgi:hypothetical protein
MMLVKGHNSPTWWEDQLMGVTILWSCLACNGGGQFLDDDQGRDDHAARFGHRPAPGRPLCPLLGQR